MVIGGYVECWECGTFLPDPLSLRRCAGRAYCVGCYQGLKDEYREPAWWDEEPVEIEDERP